MTHSPAPLSLSPPFFFIKRPAGLMKGILSYFCFVCVMLICCCVSFVYCLPFAFFSGYLSRCINPTSNREHGAPGQLREVLCRVKSKAETKKTKTTKQKKQKIALFFSHPTFYAHFIFTSLRYKSNKTETTCMKKKRCIKSKVYGYSIMQLFLATLNVNSNK